MCLCIFVSTDELEIAETGFFWDWGTLVFSTRLLKVYTLDIFKDLPKN